MMSTFRRSVILFVVAILSFVLVSSAFAKDNGDVELKDRVSFCSSCIDSEGGGDITLIGDSIAVMSEAALQEKFPSSFLNKVGSRSPTDGGVCSEDKGGVDALEKIISGSGSVSNQNASGDCSETSINSSSLKNKIVWELGTNSIGATKETIEEVLDMIGDQRELFLVTPYNGSSPDYADRISETYRRIANEHDNVYIVDWNSAMKSGSSNYLAGDGVHPTSAGSQLLASLIEEAVANVVDDGVAIYDTDNYIERLDGLDTFHQNDGPWASHSMCNNGGTEMAGHGCGVMSLYAMYYMFSGEGLMDENVLNGIIETTKKDGYNLCNMSNFLSPLPATESYTNMAAEVLWEGGYKDSYWDQMINALKEGKKLMINTLSTSCGGDSVFAGCGHILYIDHYNAEKDMIYLYDPSINGHRASYATELGPTGDYMDGIYIDRKAMANYVAPHRVRAFTYSGGGYGFCEADVDLDSEGGLSDEEAQKIVDYYKSSAVDAEEWGLPYGKANCVSLSMWFVQALTSIGKNANISDNGNGVAHQVASVGDLEEGNDPRPYAVFSVTRGLTVCEDGQLCGHTGIVLGVNGDDVMTIEAAYNMSMGKVMHRDRSYFENTKYGTSFTYLDSIMNEDDLRSILES